MKVCKVCKSELSEDAFRQGRRECRKCEYAKDKRTYATRKVHIDKLRAIVHDILTNSKCKICGESDIRTLDFHHRDPGEKRYPISQMKNLTVSFSSLREEIAKCDVLCANCHALETWDMGTIPEHVAKQRSTVDNYISDNGPCTLCGEARRGVLSFHHREPNEKVASVSALMRRHSSKAKLIEEMDKCDILCHNCHRKVHTK